MRARIVGRVRARSTVSWRTRRRARLWRRHASSRKTILRRGLDGRTACLLNCQSWCLLNARIGGTRSVSRVRARSTSSWRTRRRARFRRRHARSRGTRLRKSLDGRTAYLLDCQSWYLLNARIRGARSMRSARARSTASWRTRRRERLRRKHVMNRRTRLRRSLDRRTALLLCLLPNTPRVLVKRIRLGARDSVKRIFFGWHACFEVSRRAVGMKVVLRCLKTVMIVSVIGLKTKMRRLFLP